MSDEAQRLPDDLAELLNGYSREKDRTGCSAAGVYKFSRADETLWLKIAPDDEEIRREHDVTLWLRGKLPVPEVRFWGVRDGTAYMLTTSARGRMACDAPDGIALPAESTVHALAQGLLAFQSVDISGCSLRNTLDMKLERALFNIENGLVDMDDFEACNDFAAPMDLYAWLDANRPQEELAFTHGDYCLPNIFIHGGDATGFIDMGRGGVADKWNDIALGVRSLKYNSWNIQGNGRLVDLLFRRLGAKPDWAKINYYILLDDLF
jgi:kanamycin kinase/aminoglycoside 3'-phosphotransferase-3